MVEPVPPKNPFDPDRLEQYRKFFLAPKRSNLLGTPEGQTALEAERAGLASFLGTPDYDSQAKKHRLREMQRRLRDNFQNKREPCRLPRKPRTAN